MSRDDVSSDQPGWPSTLYDAGSPCEYRGHVILYRQGTPVDRVYLVASGVVLGIRAEPTTGEEVIVGFAGPGAILATNSAILRWPHAATTETLTDCRVREIRIRMFRDLLATDSETTGFVLRVQAQQRYIDQALIGLLAKASDVNRVKAFCIMLLRLGLPRRADGSTILPHLSQRRVGQAVRLSRETVNGCYRTLESEGLIRRHDGRVIVPATSELRRIADSEPAWMQMLVGD